MSEAASPEAGIGVELAACELEHGGCELEQGNLCELERIDRPASVVG